MSRPSRIGILGGTFDPIHIGHLAMAQVVSEKMRLDRIFFVPSYLPPHKRVVGLTPAIHRYEMVRLAIQGNPEFAASSFEIRKPGKSYTIDTLLHFANRFPGARPFFIVGQDAFSSLKTWKSPDDLLKIADFIVVNRSGDFKKPQSIRHHPVTMPGMDISSSYIRQRVQQKKSIRYLVPEAVARYIERWGLYQGAL